MTLRSRSLWKAAGFGFLAIVLVVQGVIDWRSSTEAFPTISMPTFGQAPDREGHRQIDTVRIEVAYDDGTTLSVEPEDLFEQFHYSSARFAMTNVIRSGEDLSDDTREWLEAQARRVGDGRTAQSVTFTWQPVDMDIVAVSARPVGEPTVRKVEL
ncbi:hypothetical protein [Microbacterium testaceum]|uniref:hypothetical protein n=1 Tax=Microbacterium testaceum TaxID=2033 RepID=UPI000AA69DF4|nr:hypothetical protein [Microbacterium testaceum]